MKQFKIFETVTNINHEKLYIGGTLHLDVNKV